LPAVRAATAAMVGAAAAARAMSGMSETTDALAPVALAVLVALAHAQNSTVQMAWRVRLAKRRRHIPENLAVAVALAVKARKVKSRP